MSTTALGGTELLVNRLKDAFPELTSQVQIIASRPEQYELEDKPRILWLHDLPQDPASQCLRDPSYRTKFNAIVFVSHWQQQQYNLVLGIPYHEGLVIKNGVPAMSPVRCDKDGFTYIKRPVEAGQKLQFIYTPTPHRGLNVLAAAADALAKERQDWELHVYSSLKLYGWHEQDAQFQPLYDQLQRNPCVRYHGTVPNDDIRRAVRDAHVFIYPSIYAETSCLTVQEAMMSGCLTITSNLGALIETCGEWAWMMPFSERLDDMASTTLHYMKQALDTYHEPYVQSVLANQSLYYQRFYSWESRLGSWETLLNHVIAQGPPEEKLVLGS